MSTDTMVTTRTAPWFKLGRIVETLSADEALTLGGLDFTVSARDLAFSPEGAHDGSSWTEAPHRKMIVRDDSGEPFDVVSADYPVMQYAESFRLVEDLEPTFVAAGVLKSGRQGFMVCTVPGLKELNVLENGDPHEMYVVVRTSHDRTRKIEICVMPLRLKCMNQLGLASFSKDAPQKWTIAHTPNMGEKLAQAKKSLANTAAYALELQRMAQRLEAIELTHEAATPVLQRVLKDTPTRDDKVTSILSLWGDEDTNGHPETGWGLVNAVSEYFDWQRAGGTPESRFTAVLDGFGQTYKAINKTSALLLSRR
jgi:phage/plasmid-like protein (TIGR03299 family)